MTSQNNGHADIAGAKDMEIGHVSPLGPLAQTAGRQQGNDDPHGLLGIIAAMGKGVNPRGK